MEKIKNRIDQSKRIMCSQCAFRNVCKYTLKSIPKDEQGCLREGVLGRHPVPLCKHCEYSWSVQNSITGEIEWFCCGPMRMAKVQPDGFCSEGNVKNKEEAK